MVVPPILPLGTEMLMNLSQNERRTDQSTEAEGLAFLPNDRTTAEAHRIDARVPDDRRPAFDSAKDRRRAENADRVDVPLEELRLLASHSHVGERWSAERTSRLRFGFLIAGLLAVAALLGWQHRGDEVKQMASSSMASLWPASLVSSSGVAAANGEAASASAAVATDANASAPAPALTPTAAPDRAPEVAAELQQKLQSIAHDLGVLKENLDQLAAKNEQLVAKQDQMARDIASLRAVKADNKTNAALARPRNVDPAPRAKPPGQLPPPGVRPPPPEQASSPPPQQAVRPPTQQDAGVRPTPQQDVVVRPPMPLR
jgi:hypothetical protein